METYGMPKDNEHRVFELFPPDIRASLRGQLAFGDSLFGFIREKLGITFSGDDAEAPADPKRPRAAHGSVTPSEFFKEPLLRVLGKQPKHRMRAKEAIQAVLDEVRDKLKPIDFERTSGNKIIRAENKIAFAREFLKRDGLIEEPTDKTRGLWILTAEGVKEARKLLK